MCCHWYLHLTLHGGVFGGGGGCLLLVHTIAIFPGDGVVGCFGYFTVHRIATLHKSVKGSLLCVFLGVR